MVYSREYAANRQNGSTGSCAAFSPTPPLMLAGGRTSVMAVMGVVHRRPHPERPLCLTQCSAVITLKF